MRFKNRTEAGRLLAAKLLCHSSAPALLVLALPRGGVPVAYEVASALRAPLDIFLVRKLGVPGHEEYAMGALATGGVRILNPDAVQHLGISEDVIEKVVAKEKAELERREREYRGSRPVPELRGRTVMIVDDGLATGSSMRAAVAALRQKQPARIIVAVPVAPPSAVEDLQCQADEVVCVIMPDDFYAVGQWYVDFEQTSDAEVRAYLRQAAQEPESPSSPN
ncbi:MAG: phosphoribosyl transferase [Verrucomicrobia bacterium]|nr:MAG: phosphoribosyl transferase [Verrucomicrobiota bacterium]